MELQRDNMERLLAMLGETHASGAFDDSAARYPWRASLTSAQSPSPRRHAWVWVGAPLAAAAAVAVLFVGPSLFPNTAATSVVNNVPRELLPVQPELHAEAGATSKAETLDCDFNGDGKVDGLDIQAYVERSQAIAGDPDASAELRRRGEQLQQCMLAGGS